MKEIREELFLKNFIKFAERAGLMDRGKINDLMRLAGSEWFVSIHGDNAVEVVRWPAESVVNSI